MKNQYSPDRSNSNANIFKASSKLGQRPWTIVQGILSKMAQREFYILRVIHFSDTYTLYMFLCHV